VSQLKHVGDKVLAVQFFFIFLLQSRYFSSMASNNMFIIASNGCDILSIVKKFQQLQEERTHVYHLFNEGHKIYLHTAPNFNVAHFRQLMDKITQLFKRIFEENLIIESRIRMEFGNTKLANYISKIEEVEKLKLELTAQLQLAKEKACDYSGEPEREIHVLEMKQRLNRVSEKLDDYLEEVQFEIADL